MGKEQPIAGLFMYNTTEIVLPLAASETPPRNSAGLLSLSRGSTDDQTASLSATLPCLRLCEGALLICFYRVGLHCFACNELGSKVTHVSGIFFASWRLTELGTASPFLFACGREQRFSLHLLVLLAAEAVAVREEEGKKGTRLDSVLPSCTTSTGESESE